MVIFIVKSGQECLALNPNLKCIEPDYCFLEYLDKEFTRENLRIRYCQAVTFKGKENESIKFKVLPTTKILSIYHKGPYANLGEAYSFIVKFIEKNKIKITGLFREVYIDGLRNQEDDINYLTEIQVPVDL